MEGILPRVPDGASAVELNRFRDRLLLGARPRRTLRSFCALCMVACRIWSDRCVFWGRAM